MASSRKDFGEVKLTDTKFKDVGRRIAPERYEAFIDRVFAAPERRPSRVVSVGDALIDSAFSRD
jgi:hypothetical protein